MVKKHHVQTRCFFHHFNGLNPQKTKISQNIILEMEIEILRFAIIKDSSTDEDSWSYASKYGVTALYTMKLQTVEGSLFTLFCVWWLCTIIFSISIQPSASSQHPASIPIPLSWCIDQDRCSVHAVERAQIRQLFYLGEL
jgi:hypothetical protein